MQYELASLTLTRNEYILEEMKTRLPESVSAADLGTVKVESPLRIARMYQNLCNNLEALGAVPTRWFSDAVAGEIVNEVAAREACYSAYRTLWVARSYTESSQFTEAFVVYDSIGAKASLAAGAVAQCPNLDPQVVQAVEALPDAARSGRAYATACAALQSIDGKNNSAQSVPILQRPNAFVTQVGPSTLAAFPPDFTPIPCQPLFFDLASTYLSFPDLSSKTGIQRADAAASTSTSAPPAATASTPSEPAPVEEAPKKTGWFGLW